MNIQHSTFNPKGLVPRGVANIQRSATAAVCLALLAIAGAAPTTRPAPTETIIAVLDFDAERDATKEMGARIAEAVWMKLDRTKGIVLIDRQSAREALAGAGVAVDRHTRPAVVAKAGTDVLRAHIVVWGSVERQALGDRFTIHARALDLTAGIPNLYIDDAFRARGYREVPFAVQRIVNAIRRDEMAPDPAVDRRDPGPIEPNPKVLARPNLVTNGDFETGAKTPDHWEPVDGLTSFWVKAPDRPGKCLMFDTDVNDAQWVAWHKTFTLGTTDPPPKPIRGTGHKYETVGGLHGAWLYTSDFIPVKKGVAYRLSFDFRSTSRGAKVFVKGYALVGGQRREVYRMYKACRVKTNGRQWEHFTRAFSPTERTPRVRWIKVEPFAYWPPTRYYFDNLHLCEE